MGHREREVCYSMLSITSSQCLGEVSRVLVGVRSAWEGCARAWNLSPVLGTGMLLDRYLVLCVWEASFSQQSIGSQCLGGVIR